MFFLHLCIFITKKKHQFTASLTTAPTVVISFAMCGIYEGNSFFNLDISWNIKLSIAWLYNPFSCKILLIYCWQLLSKASWEKYRLFLSISLVFSSIEYKSYLNGFSINLQTYGLEHCRILVILFSLLFSSHWFNASIHPNVL